LYNCNLVVLKHDKDSERIGGILNHKNFVYFLNIKNITNKKFVATRKTKFGTCKTGNL
jgi:hypothetical protein